MALDLFDHHGISQLPVLHDGQAIGSIQEITLARILHDRVDPRHLNVEQVMARALPQLDAAINLDEAYRVLMAGNTGVLVTRHCVIDIVTRIDLVHFWNQQRPVAAAAA